MNDRNYAIFCEDRFLAPLKTPCDLIKGMRIHFMFNEYTTDKPLQLTTFYCLGEVSGIVVNDVNQLCECYIKMIELDTKPIDYKSIK